MKSRFAHRQTCLLLIFALVLSVMAVPFIEIKAEDIIVDYGASDITEPEDKNAYPYMEDTGEESDAVIEDDLNVVLQGTDVSISGILTIENNTEHILLGAVVDNPNNYDLEYKWVACADGDDTWFEVKSWTRNSEYLDWIPETYGVYVLVVQVRVAGEESYISFGDKVEYHPYIIGKCQMPYTGEGGGYLIGFESKDNPNQQYWYEMLILDCTLLAEGKPPWIYTTNKCWLQEGKALWTVWQPEYGYYWTLFRLFDADGNIIDEACYGFENVPKPVPEWASTYGYSVIEPYLDAILAKCTNDSMTQGQKLRAAYLYVVNNYNYKSLSANRPAGWLEPEYYAYVTMTTGNGNCYGFSSVFYYLALKLGYDAKWYHGAVGTRKDPHGWVEIGGLIYDPELERYNEINLYGVTNGHPYKYWY